MTNTNKTNNNNSKEYQTSNINKNSPQFGLLLFRSLRGMLSTQYCICVNTVSILTAQSDNTHMACCWKVQLYHLVPIAGLYGQK